MSDSHDAPPLHGRRALVTGASRGIGAAIARKLAEQGAEVILTARNHAAIDGLAADLVGRGLHSVAISADVADRASLTALMDEIRANFESLDILVNNAGVLPPATRAEQVSWDAWDETLAINLSAPWYLACRARELMRGPGVIVNNASTAALYPSRGLVAYNASKAALVMVTRTLALEWARDGIRVIGVAPGKVATELVQPILRWAEKREMPLNPMGRIGLDTEIADLVAFLVSDHAAYMTGVTVPIDGGELLWSGSA